jgi:hypothetical protein
MDTSRNAVHYFRGHEYPLTPPRLLIPPPSTNLLDSKLPLNLLPPLLLLEILPEPLDLLAHALLALLALSLLIHGAPAHNPRNDFRGIYVLELVVGNFAVDVEGLGHGVGVIGQWHELGNAVVDGGGGRVGKREKEGFGEGEGGAEDDGVDVLSRLAWVISWEGDGLLCIAARRGRARRRS